MTHLPAVPEASETLLRSLLGDEEEDLRQKLAAAEARIAELEGFLSSLLEPALTRVKNAQASIRSLQPAVDANPRDDGYRRDLKQAYEERAQVIGYVRFLALELLHMPEEEVMRRVDQALQ